MRREARELQHQSRITHITPAHVTRSVHVPHPLQQARRRSAGSVRSWSAWSRSVRRCTSSSSTTRSRISGSTSRSREHLLSKIRWARIECDPTQRLRSMFDMQMIINPSIQIYLLDAPRAHRRVLGRARRGQVETGRSRADPGFDRTRCQASLARRRSARSEHAAHLLGRAATRRQRAGISLRRCWRPSARPGSPGCSRRATSCRVPLRSPALSVLVALLVGLGIFALMTRKLERLAAAMDEFQRSDFSQRPQLPAANDPGGDEIDRLAISFREMASRITAQLQTLKQNDQLRRELVANVSHDLKTPIATLQGYVDTLLLKDSVALRRGSAQLSDHRFAQLRAARQDGGRPDRARQAGSERGDAPAGAFLGGRTDCRTSRRSSI